jgi:hypothetical protein
MKTLPFCRRSELFGGDPVTPSFQIISSPLNEGRFELGVADLGDPDDFVVEEFSLCFSSI